MTDELMVNGELETLLAAALDDRLSEAGRAQLEQLLQQSDDDLDCYVEQAVLHAMLHWEHAPPLGRNDGCRRTDDELSPDSFADGGAMPAHHSSFIIHHSSFPLALAGSAGLSYVVASLLLAAGVVAAWAWNSPGPSQQFADGAAVRTPPAASSPEVMIVAKVTRLRGVTFGHWKHADQAPKEPDRRSLGLLVRNGARGNRNHVQLRGKSHRRGAGQVPCELRKRRGALAGQTKRERRQAAAIKFRIGRRIRAWASVFTAFHPSHPQHGPDTARRRIHGLDRRVRRKPNGGHSRPG